jgi:hypothetical protein
MAMIPYNGDCWRGRLRYIGSAPSLERGLWLSRARN